MNIRTKERLDWIINKMEIGRLYSWDTFSKPMGIPIPENGNLKDRRIYVQDRCGCVCSMNERLKTMRELTRIKVHRGRGVERVPREMVPIHVATTTVKKIGGVDVRGLDRLKAINESEGISIEDRKRNDKLIALIETMEEILRVGIRRNPYTRGILINIVE